MTEGKSGMAFSLSAADKEAVAVFLQLVHLLGRCLGIVSHCPRIEGFPV